MDNKVQLEKHIRLLTTSFDLPFILLSSSSQFSPGVHPVQDLCALGELGPPNSLVRVVVIDYKPPQILGDLPLKSWGLPLSNITW